MYVLQPIQLRSLQVTIMLNIRIEIFDPRAATTEQWAAYHAYRRQRHDDDKSDGILDEPLWPDDTVEAAMKTEYPLFREELWAAMRDDRIFAILTIGQRREGTDGYAEHAPHCSSWVSVLKKHQRRGLGRLMLQHLADQMLRYDKSILSINARTPAGHAFLSATGAQLKQIRVVNQLDLETVDWPLMMRWEDVSKVSPAVHWEVHAGRVPFTRWERLIEPLSVLLNQAPLDGLDVPAMRVEIEGVRAWYEQMDRYGGSHIMVLLKSTADENAPLIGISNGDWDARQPEWIGQHLTAVVPEQRGRGLAKALKARFLRIAHQTQPARWVRTFNSKSNGPMLAINQQIGFKPVREPATYQITRERLLAHLSTVPGRDFRFDKP